MKRLAFIFLLTILPFATKAQFGIIVNGKDVYRGEYVKQFEGFEQYLTHIYMNAGDYCQLYDLTNKVSWTKPLNSSSTTAFTLRNNRYECATAGCYDFYIKIKNNADELYIQAGSNCNATPDNSDDSDIPPYTPVDYASAVPEQCTDVMLQAFYWKSASDYTYGSSKWYTLKAQADEINSYFDIVWLPPSCVANDEMGYLPKQYSNQNCKMGGDIELKQLIAAFHSGNTKVLADVVINHAGNNNTWVDFLEQDFGTYGKFQPVSTWITSNDEAQGKGTLGSHADDGQDPNTANYKSARDWDHLNTNVQNMCRAYTQWLKNVMKYDGFRFDYCGGFHVSHVNDYVSAAKPYFSVMEYWNGDASILKQRIDQAGKNTLTFDFATFHKAIQEGIAVGKYNNLTTPTLRGKGYSKYAVTFVDNHDTFNRADINNTDAGNSFDGRTTLANRELMMQCNAFILSMPGIPCVFYPHWYTYKSEIKEMIHARKSAGIHSESSVIYEESSADSYKATIQGKYGLILLYLGTAASSSVPAEFKQAIKSSKVAMYYTGDGSTALEETTTTFDQNAPAYNILGQPVNTRYQGLVIQNGKKYIVQP